MIDPIKLKSCREQVEVNLKLFCERTGVLYTSWNKWENGERNPSNPEKVLKYLNGYKIEGFKMSRIKPFVMKDIEKDV